MDIADLHNEWYKQKIAKIANKNVKRKEFTKGMSIPCWADKHWKVQIKVKLIASCESLYRVKQNLLNSAY